MVGNQRAASQHISTIQRPAVQPAIQHAFPLMMLFNFSFAATSSAAIPGSLAECPASGTTYDGVQSQGIKVI